MYVQQVLPKIRKNSYIESASLWARNLGHIVLCVEQLFCYFEFSLKGNDKREEVYKIKRRFQDPDGVDPDPDPNEKKKLDPDQNLF